MPETIIISKGAVLSECRRYRYKLLRIWTKHLPLVAFIGLNPSIADEELDDPTIRKCMGFARRWGCGGMLMLNLFAWRATKPAELKHCNDAIGRLNTFKHLREYLVPCRFAVAAWGANARGRGYAASLELGNLFYLRTNSDGSPEHPLYIPYETSLKPFNFEPTEETEGIGA